MIGPTNQGTEGSYTKNTGVERRRAAWDKAKCTPLGVDEGAGGGGTGRGFRRVGMEVKGHSTLQL